MAETHAVTTGHTAMDYAEHERTYRGFLTLSKWVIIHIVVILILMAYFLV